MNDTEKTISLTLTIKQEIKLKDVENLLCCALEGGSNYWYNIASHKCPPEDKLTYKGFSDLYSAPFNAGGFIKIEDMEEGDKVYKLNLAAIEKGLQTMAEKYPHQFANFIQDNADAETGDVFLQCCLFNDVIYG